MIGNYKVRKATTSSFEVQKDNPFYFWKTIAWFTTDIPIGAGLARYYGLLGLIVELGYEKVAFRYILKDIEYQASVPEGLKENLSKDYQVDRFDLLYNNFKKPKKATKKSK